MTPEWDRLYTYQRGDLVKYKGTDYICCAYNPSYSLGEMPGTGGPWITKPL